MSTIDDGGPVHPTLWNSEHNSSWLTVDGMSLRDAAALAALQGFCANPEMTHVPVQRLSEFCWEQADAFIAARKGGNDA